LQSIGQADSSEKTQRVLLGSLVAALLLVSAAGLGAAATEDFLETNVTKESSDDPLEIEVAYADEFGTDDTDSEITSADATVTWYNATEYQNDSDTATEIHNATITGEEGQTLTQSYDRGDISALEYGTEYSVVVSADNSTVDDAARVDGLLGGAAGSSVDGSPGFGVGVAIVALIGAGVAAARRD